MNNKQKVISILSILSGIILALIGIAGIWFYISSVISSIGQADQSLIFWYIPFLFFGFIFLAAAVYFFIIGIRALRGTEIDYKLVKNSLIILFVLSLILILVGIINSI